MFGSFWPVHNSGAMSPTTTQQCRPRRHSNVAQDDTNRNIRATEIPNRKENGSESGLDCALLRTFQSAKLLDRRKNAPARDLGRLNADGPLVGYEDIEPILRIHCRTRTMGSCLCVRVEVPVDGGVAVMI